MTTQRKFEPRNPTSKAAIPRDGALNAKRQRAAELDDDMLDQVTGGYPPNPCAPNSDRVAGSFPPNPC
jgi:hypothetical protein